MSLRIGTKIVLSIGAIVLLCMLGLTYIVTTNVDEEQTIIAEKLLSAVANDSKHVIDSNINGVHISLLANAPRIEAIINSGGGASQQERLEERVVSMLDGNISGIYGYVYVRNNAYTGERIANPRNKLKNGEFMILAHDTDPDMIGGVKLVQADMTFFR